MPDPDPADRPDPDKPAPALTREAEEKLRVHLREASGAAFRKVEASAPPSVSSRLRVFRERIRKRRTLDTAWRMMVLTLGLTLVSAGLLMFVLPGPGFGATILGLVVLASEFTWATRVLDPVKDAARRAQEVAMDPRKRRRNLTLGALAGVVAGAVVLWYLWSFGMTVAPIVGWLEWVLDQVRGLFA
jgi:uncharacterized protein (TIGR02611 family)